MYSSWDADPQLNLLSVTTSDSVINAERDGHNTRYVIELDSEAISGGFTVRITNAAGQVQDVVVSLDDAYVDDETRRRLSPHGD